MKPIKTDETPDLPAMELDGLVDSMRGLNLNDVGNERNEIILLSDEEFEINQIKEHQMAKYGSRMYKTNFKGFADNDISWIPERNFSSSIPIMEYYVRTVNTLLKDNYTLRYQINMHK